MKKKQWIKKAIVAAALVAAAASYFFVPAVNQLVGRITKMFASGDFTAVEEFVDSYGGYAVIVSFLLMIFQSIAAPLPAFLILFTFSPWLTAVFPSRNW